MASLRETASPLGVGTFLAFGAALFRFRAQPKLFSKNVEIKTNRVPKIHIY